MITGAYAVYTIFTNILDEVNTALEASPGGRAVFKSFFPGEIAWDNCCEGLLGIGVTNQYLASDFPRSVTARMNDDSSPCRAAWYIVDGVISIIRCAPVPQGNTPTVSEQQLTLTARTMSADAWILLDTMYCYLEELKTGQDIIDYVIRDTSSVGPEGGCVGSELVFSIALFRGV